MDRRRSGIRSFNQSKSSQPAQQRADLQIQEHSAVYILLVSICIDSIKCSTVEVASRVVDSVWFILLVYQTKWHVKKVKLADGVTESQGHTAGQARDIVSSLVLASAD